ncbi:MAG: polysaccharide biosynthesis tyrosine autokinase [Odoribacter sp.]|nr:polysaccharide biosynthesis tyrosine autokinase [Odoribacter sp.]
MSEDDKINKIDKKLPADDVLDTTGLLLDYLANWKWFVISAVIFLIGAYFYISTIVPTYQVNASIYLNNDDSQSKNAFSFNPENPIIDMKNYIDETELEILKSRNNVIEIVDSLKMAYSYWRVGNLRDIPLYNDRAINAVMDSMALNDLEKPIFITVTNGSEENKYDVEVNTIFNEVDEHKNYTNVQLPLVIDLSVGDVTVSRVEQVPELEGIERVEITNPRAVAARLSAGLNIAFEEKAPTIVRIAYNTPIPREGIDVINTLIDFYNRQIIEDKNRSAMQTEAFILERLVMINDELRDVEQRLQEYRQAHNISNLEQQVSSNLQTAKTTQTQLAEIEAQAVVINEIEATIKRANNFDPLPAVTSDNTLNSVIVKYNAKVSRLTRMLETSTPDNPLVRTLQEELIRDKADILQSVSSVKRGIQARRNNIAAIEGRTEGQLSSLPPIDKGLQEIFREQQVKVNIYTFLLQKREEIALQKTLATPTARLIDDPTSTGPVAPRRMIIYFMALLLGLAVPAGIIFLKRFFFPIYKDQEELQRLTNVPILGEISTDLSKDGNDIVVGANVSTAIAELFRLLRNNIGFTKNGANKKVILVTSSISGEGKTFVATNLALTYALTGKKVVVVGMDIRRPVLAHKFGLNNQQGVTTFLSGQTSDIKSLLHHSDLSENLYILPAGPIPPNPNELLLSDNMTRLMDQLRADFDYVILDTAPIGVISDSFLIIPHSDIQLYVTRASYSTKSCLKVLHQAIRDNRLSDPYIVLNGVNMNAGSYSYRKYGHYYRSTNGTYGYGYGYSSDNKDKRQK